MDSYVRSIKYYEITWYPKMEFCKFCQEDRKNQTNNIPSVDGNHGNYHVETQYSNLPGHISSVNPQVIHRVTSYL